MSEFLRSGRSPWPATPLIAIASYTSLYAYAVMVTLGSWMTTLAAVLAATTVAMMVTRMATRSKVLPTIVGLVATVVAMIPAYARTEEGARHILPTPTALRALTSTLGDGFTEAQETVAPAIVTPGMGALFAVIVVGLFIFAEALAVSGRFVATAGLVLILPWIPAVVLGHRVSTSAMLLALAAWLMAMTLSRRNAPVERGTSLSAGVLSTGATVLLTVMVVPSALGGNGWGMFPQFDTPEALEQNTRLNLALDLRNSLTNNSSSAVIIYRTDGSRPDALRLYTLTDFDGAAWDREVPEPTDRRADTGVLWSEPISNWAQSSPVRLDISVLSLTERNLPLPTSPRSVEVVGPWTYDAALDEVIGDATTTKDLTYAVAVNLRYHDPARLRAADQLLTSNPDADIDEPRYTELDDSLDRERIETLTEEVIGGATTRYDTALRIQSYLRDPEIFTYDTTVNPSGSDTVSAFFDSQSGYCVQFATAMVAMLRSQDIPARLGVGFLPGTFDGSGTYVIRGSDAHAWPEVYFPGHGWVRFEPTPGLQTGAPPTWADPYAGQVPVPLEVLENGTHPVTPSGESTGPEPARPDPSPGFGEDPPAATPWALIIGVVVLVAGGVVAGVWWFRQGGAAASRRHLSGPEGAWYRLSERLGEFRWPASATPAEAREMVATGISRTAGRPLEPRADSALAGLSSAVSDHRYGPAGTSVPQQQLDEWVGEVVEEADAATAEITGRPARGGARGAPRGDA